MTNIPLLHGKLKKYTTVWPRSSDSFYIVTYYIKWVTTSWTYSKFLNKFLPEGQNGGLTIENEHHYMCYS